MAQVLDKPDAWTLVTWGAGAGRAQRAVVRAGERRHRGRLSPLAGAGLPLVGRGEGVGRAGGYAEVSVVSAKWACHAGCVRLVSR